SSSTAIDASSAWRFPWMSEMTATRMVASRNLKPLVPGGRFGQVPDALGGLVLRPGILHRVEQLLHEPRGHVHARHDDAGHVPFLDLVVDARERDRELVRREADV